MIGAEQAAALPTWAAIVIGVAPAIAAIVVVILQNRKTRDKVSQLDETNSSQHGANVSKLDEVIQVTNQAVGRLVEIHGAVDRLDSKVDRLSERVAVVEANGEAASLGTSDRHLEVTVERLPRTSRHHPAS